MPKPITAVPPDYHEAEYLLLTSPENLAKLNVWGLGLIVPFFALAVAASRVAQAVRGVDSAPVSVPGVLVWLGVLMVLPLHELCHGVAIRWAGHHPRYGAKFIAFGPLRLPYVLYATADQALFRRHEFVIIALAPLTVITVGCLGLMLLVPDALLWAVSAALILNGAGAVGDLWMTWAVLRHPRAALIRDEADGIRIFAPGHSDQIPTV